GPGCHETECDAPDVKLGHLDVPTRKAHTMALVTLEKRTAACMASRRIRYQSGIFRTAPAGHIVDLQHYFPACRWDQRSLQLALWRLFRMVPLAEQMPLPTCA